jgi:hypothetical protein
MRGAHLLVPLALGLALLSASGAQADITPVLKPNGPAKTVTPLAKPTAGAPQQPVKKQPVQQPVKQPVKQPVQQQQPVHTQTPANTATGSTTPPVLASGGREQPTLGPVVRTTRAKPGTSLPSQIAKLFPTRLAQVGHESLPSYDTWPSWVLGAFTLLASAEAFLLVRLARARRFQQEALQEVPDL